MEEELLKRLLFIIEIKDYFNLNIKKDKTTLIKLDKIGNKFDYENDVLKTVFEKASKGEYGSFKQNGKNYKITQNEVRFLLGASGKKEGGILPILPILGGLALAGGIYGVNKLKNIIKDKLADINSEKEKNGGILPLLALLPLIFGGVAAAGAVTGGIAGAVTGSQKAKAEEERTRIAAEQAKKDDLLREEQIKLLRAKDGQGFIQDAGKFVNEAGNKIKGFFDGIGEKVQPYYKKIFGGEGLGEDFDIDEIQHYKHPRILISQKGHGGIESFLKDFNKRDKKGKGLYFPSKGKGIILPENKHGDGIFLPSREM